MAFRRTYGLPGLPASFNNGTLFFVVDSGVDGVVVVVVDVVVVVIVDITFGTMGTITLAGFFNRAPVILTLFSKLKLKFKTIKLN